jgi:anti-anti-sigma factor
MLDPAHLRVERIDDLVVVHLDGEVDMGNADRLARRVLHGIDDVDASGRPVVIDVAAISYLDSSGLRMLEQIRASVSGDGRRTFTLAPESCRAHRLLALTGLLEHLGTVPDLDAVRAELSRRSDGASSGT